MLVSVLLKFKFIMKVILCYVFILGWYGMCIGCVFVNRGKWFEVIKSMMKVVKDGDVFVG